MEICVLSSGSKGNMTYVSYMNTHILIDCGITLCQAKKRCQEIDFNNITDVLITHEHSDHVKELSSVLKKTNANLYISKKTFDGLKENIKDELVGKKVCFIEEDGCYKIGDVMVCTCLLLHDCNNVFGYIIICGDKKFGTFTDTGIFPSRYKNLLSDLDCYLIEANHNIEMLMESDRDFYLKNRILSTKGHMSNKACYELINETISSKNEYIILGHVSEDCNSYDYLYEEIISKLDCKGEIIVASQKEATKLIKL